MDDTSKGGNLMPDANSVFAPKPAGWQRTGHWIATADFPKPLVIAGLKYWDASEVAAWLAAQPHGSGHTPVAALRARGVKVEGYAAGKREAQADATAATGSKGRIGFTRGARPSRGGYDG
jgi:hypothetical protein